MNSIEFLKELMYNNNEKLKELLPEVCTDQQVAEAISSVITTLGVPTQPPEVMHYSEQEINAAITDAIYILNK